MNLRSTLVRAAGVFLSLALLASGCDNAREEIELTLDELKAAMLARDGEACVRLVAPESFAHYDHLIGLALDATAAQVGGLSISDRADLLMMRNRLTRKELSGMDGRAWLVHAVRRGWYGPGLLDEEVERTRIDVRGTTAQVEFIFPFRWGLFQGAKSGKKVKDYMTFLKVDDRWLVDARRPATLFEQVVHEFALRSNLTVDDVLVRLESDDSGKDVDRSIWNPMKR